MFIATFVQPQPQSGKFTADKNGNLPYIGQVQAGKYRSSIVNGTMFQRDNRKVGTMYLCKNVPASIDGEPLTDSNGNQLWNTEIISEVTVLDLINSASALGPAFRITEQVETEETVTTPEASLV